MAYDNRGLAYDKKGDTNRSLADMPRGTMIAPSLTTPKRSGSIRPMPNSITNAAM